METVADLLEKAADALESGRISWGKYDVLSLSKPPGAWCAAETIDLVAREMGLRKEEERDVGDLADRAVSLHVSKGRGIGHLTAWNDTEARTVDDVIQAFKETAKEFRNQAQAPEQVIL